MEKDKRHIFIVEGSDLSGKSTLIDALSKKYPGFVVKNTDKPKDGSIFERNKIRQRYFSMLEFAIREEEPNFVFDRFYFSEMVYSAVKRGYEAFDDKIFIRLDETLRDMGAKLIYCSPGISTLNERFDKRGDDFIMKNDLPEIVERYNKALEWTALDKIVVDTTKPTEESLALIEKALQ